PHVLDRAGRTLEGLATSLGSSAPRYGRSLATAAFPQVLGTTVLQAEKEGGTAIDWQADPRPDSEHGSDECFVACAAHSRRASQARNQDFRAHRFSHPADCQTAPIADLEDLSTEPPGGDRRDSLLHRTHGQDARTVRVHRPGAPAAEGASLWSHGTSDRGMGRAAGGGGLRRAGGSAVSDPRP